MTTTGIRQMAINFSNELSNLGINNSVNHSSTSFGNSSYIIAGRFKVRCSDHSTGHQRMLEEYPLFEMTFNSILETIERHYYPERFKELSSLVFGDAHELCLNKVPFDYPYEIEVLQKDIKVSQKGNVISIVRKKNVQIKTYIRITN